MPEKAIATPQPPDYPTTGYSTATGCANIPLMTGSQFSSKSANKPIKGRGAQTNRAGRFETQVTEFVDDGWERDPHPQKVRTEQLVDSSRSVIAYNSSPDIRFDRSVNPYRGCEHGCSYCFARPTHTYLGMSAGIDFETRIMVKHDAADLLANELQKPSYRCDTIALSPNTDCYQPIERELKLTRDILKVLQRAEHPVTIVTKSSLVTRDIDILSGMAKQNLANVVISVTTLDATLSRKLEPRASAPHRRLETLQKLYDAGVPTGVLVAPVIPFINDNEIENILEACKQSGVVSAGYVLLRLPHEVRDLWIEWLDTHFPDRAERVMKAIRASRGGKDYNAEFGNRMTGTGEIAELIAQRFKLARKRLGLQSSLDNLDTVQFNPAALSDQLSLF